MADTDAVNEPADAVAAAAAAPDPAPVVAPSPSGSNRSHSSLYHCSKGSAGDRNVTATSPASSNDPGAQGAPSKASGSKYSNTRSGSRASCRSPNLGSDDDPVNDKAAHSTTESEPSEALRPKRHIQRTSRSLLDQQRGEKKAQRKALLASVS